MVGVLLNNCQKRIKNYLSKTQKIELFFFFPSQLGLFEQDQCALSSDNRSADELNFVVKFFTFLALRKLCIFHQINKSNFRRALFFSIILVTK